MTITWSASSFGFREMMIFENLAHDNLTLLQTSSVPIKKRWTLEHLTLVCVGNPIKFSMKTTSNMGMQLKFWVKRISFASPIQLDRTYEAIRLNRNELKFHAFEHHPTHMKLCLILTHRTRFDGHHNYSRDLNLKEVLITSLFQKHKWAWIWVERNCMKLFVYI